MIPLTYWLMAAMLTPLLGALVISRLDKLPDYREAVTLVTASILFSINVYLFNHLDAAFLRFSPSPLPVSWLSRFLKTYLRCLSFMSS